MGGRRCFPRSDAHGPSGRAAVHASPGPRIALALAHGSQAINHEKNEKKTKQKKEKRQNRWFFSFLYCVFSLAFFSCISCVSWFIYLAPSALRMPATISFTSCRLNFGSSSMAA